MRITDAWIDDPLSRGELDVPGLCVEVDEYPQCTIEPETFVDGWTTSKWGPFVVFSHLGNGDAGAYNRRFPQFPVVIDITLFCNGEQYHAFSLPLTRARQLVRKHAPNWRLLVNDKAATKGQLLWVPVEHNPACKEYFPETGTVCGKRPVGTVRDGGVDKTLCSQHREQHNARAAAKRTRTS